MATSEAKALADALRELREAKDLSQEEAAHESEIDRSFFGKLERGEQSPTVTTLWKIFNGIGIKPSELLARSEEILEKDG